MECKDLVSVIIPAYNTEKYIAECLQSVIDQTYSNLEIIVVNDGSSDDTLKIINNFKNKDNRIIVINQEENFGLSESRNMALNIASGKYITFVDSDDILDIEFVNFLLSKIKLYNLDMVSCGERCFYTKGFVDNNHELSQNTFYLFNNIEAINDLNKNHAYTFEGFPRKITSRSIYDNLRFEEGRIHEDTILCMNYYYKINKGAHYCKQLYFRRRKDSITGSSVREFSQRNLDKLYGYEQQINFLREKRYPHIKTVYRKFFGTWVYFYLIIIRSNLIDDNLLLEMEKYYKNYQDEVKNQNIIFVLFFYLYKKHKKFCNKIICLFLRLNDVLKILPSLAR